MTKTINKKKRKGKAKTVRNFKRKWQRKILEEEREAKSKARIRESEMREQKRRQDEQEDILNEQYKLDVQKQEAADLRESQRVSRAQINEPVPFTMYTNNDYFPKKGNEVVLNFSFRKGNSYTDYGIVSNVTDTDFTILNYKSGRLQNVAELIANAEDGSCTIQKLSTGSSEDCLVSFRNEALDFVKADFSKLEIVSIQPNPYATQGNPAFDVFCKFLQKEYPIMIAYHGTPRKNVSNILKSRIQAGDMNYHGKGAYFTTNPMKAYDYGSNRHGAGYEKDAAIRDIIACALSLNPANYDFTDAKRPVDEIVNRNVVSNMPLFHLRVRHSGFYSTKLPEGHETFFFDPSDKKTAVLAASSTNFRR